MSFTAYIMQLLSSGIQKESFARRLAGQPTDSSARGEGQAGGESDRCRPKKDRDDALEWFPVDDEQQDVRRREQSRQERIW